MTLWNRVALSLLLFAFPWITPVPQTPDDQTNLAEPVVLTPEVRRQVNELAKRFRRAKKNLALRMRIADEAIQTGKPYAEKLLAITDSELTKSLESYGTAFRKQLEKSDRFTVADVLATSGKLQEARHELVQSGTLSFKLRDFVHPEARLAKQHLPKSFEDTLKNDEEDVVENWLLGQGYRQLTNDETLIISSINKLRKEAGLQELEIDYKLCFAARDHSRDMVQKHFFSHNSPVGGKTTFRDRAKRLGTVAFGENIAQINTGVSPVDLWLKSRPHKLTMLGRWYNTIGVGCFDNNCTAMFGRKPGSNTVESNDQNSKKSGQHP